MKKKIGVVLSGGGVRGLAHVGFLKALNEFGIQPDYVSGCSSGALVGALYAAGCTTEEMLDYFSANANIFSLTKVSTKRTGMFNSEKYISTLDSIILNDSFDALQCQLIVNATDILKGELSYFSTGDVKRKVIASATVPGIFTPIEIDGGVFVDGGAMDNFPVKPLLNKDLTIIGSFVSMFKDVTLEEMTNPIKLVNRAGKLVINAKAVAQFELCDHILAPKVLSNYSLFDTKSMKKIYEIGYQETHDYLSKMI
jgi:NTE family protein